MKKLIGQVMKFIKHIFQTLVPATAIALTGCSNGGYVLGGEYLDSHMHTVIIDTCTVKMTTVSIDSVATTNKKRGFTGNCYSKYFGKISAATYMSYKKPGIITGFDDQNYKYDFKFDSVALVMTLNGSYYGDTLKPQAINVYSLKKPIDLPDNGNFYSNWSEPYYSTPLASKTILPRPATKYTDKGMPPFYENTNHFYIRLPDSLGIGILNKYLTRTNSITNNDTKWLDFFPGLAITAGNESSAILGFKVSTDSLCSIKIYYHYTLETKKKLTLDLTVDPSRNYYGIKYDRKDSKFSALGPSNKGLKEEVDTRSSDNMGLVQAMTASYVRVEFPYLNELLQLGDFGAITEAALVVYPVPESFSDTIPLPTNLSLFISDKNDALLAQVTSAMGAPLTGNINRNYSDKSKTYYSYDISSFVNGQLGKSGLYKQNLQISTPKDSLSTSFNTMILGNQKYRSDATRLIIKYLIYENH